jgi:mannose-6-phosphate isomerase-like protein (cupin superfamily)
MSIHFGIVEDIHTDTRRTIAEWSSDTLSVQHYHLHENANLGNHYHEHKTETFYIIEGGGILRYREIVDETSPLQELILRKNMAVSIEPYTAHVFMLSAGTVMVCVSSKSFDTAHPDMISYHLG